LVRSVSRSPRPRPHLHELDPSWEPNARALDRASAYDAIGQHIAGRGGIVARLARALVARCRDITLEVDQLAAEITKLVERLAPSLVVSSAAAR
jgi:transposase